MSAFICPKCNNYTYDCSKPCAKCGFNFEDSKKVTVKVKNGIKNTIYYDFSYGAGFSILPGCVETLKIREHVAITFFFHAKNAQHDYVFYECDFTVKDEKYVELTTVEENGKYVLQVFYPEK